MHMTQPAATIVPFRAATDRRPICRRRQGKKAKVAGAELRCAVEQRGRERCRASPTVDPDSKSVQNLISFFPPAWSDGKPSESVWERDRRLSRRGNGARESRCLSEQASTHRTCCDLPGQRRRKAGVRGVRPCHQWPRATQVVTGKRAFLYPGLRTRVSLRRLRARVYAISGAHSARNRHRLL